MQEPAKAKPRRTVAHARSVAEESRVQRLGREKARRRGSAQECRGAQSRSRAAHVLAPKRRPRAALRAARIHAPLRRAKTLHRAVRARRANPLHGKQPARRLVGDAVEWRSSSPLTAPPVSGKRPPASASRTSCTFRTSTPARCIAPSAWPPCASASTHAMRKRSKRSPPAPPSSSFPATRRVVLLEGEDITSLIRTPEISMAASNVSAVAVACGASWCRCNRSSAAAKAACSKGATSERRSSPETESTSSSSPPGRRARQSSLQRAHLARQPADYESVLADCLVRDTQDSTRADSPLTYDDTYTVIDTSDLTLPEVVTEIVTAVRAYGVRKPQLPLFVCCFATPEHTKAAAAAAALHKK